MSATDADGDAPQAVDDRLVRALTQPMDVYPDDPAVAAHEVAVYHRGTRYVVDPAVPTCDCPDMLHRRPDAGCKHALRAQLALGERAPPSWADPAAVDAPLADRLDWRD